MKKILGVSIVLILTFATCFAQTLPLPLPTLQEDWKRIYVKHVGSFDLPPTMEIQSGEYKQQQNELYKTLEYDDTPELVAQQRGLNDRSKNGFEKYARVLIETINGSPGDFERLNFNINTYTKKDINELNSIFQQQVQHSNSKLSGKLLEWYPVKLENVNGMSCIHISFLRQFNNNPPVMVHMYMFHNNDRLHRFTLSYRLSEAGYWKTDFEKILKSFRITNIK